MAGGQAPRRPLRRGTRRHRAALPRRRRRGRRRRGRNRGRVAGGLDTGWRQADTEAAAQLGPRKGSAFRAQPREVWQEEKYDDAQRRCRGLTSTGLNRSRPGHCRTGQTYLPAKRSWAGQMARR
ncbi:DUF429 domain-containing protein [Streptomyces platensis]|uniref:DUF429 domain-containing protein n=1 Tax=Streptomyces platensis TaxID=58346 RepID=UPI002E0E7295